MESGPDHDKAALLDIKEACSPYCSSSASPSELFFLSLADQSMKKYASLWVWQIEQLTSHSEM